MLWFLLIDAIVAPLRKIRKQMVTDNKTDVDARLKIDACLIYFMKSILFRMMGYVALPSIVSKIVADHGGDEFADFKLIILGILDTYTYEKSILEIANHLMQQDMHNATRELYHKRNKALRTKLNFCNLCKLKFEEPKDRDPNSVVVFYCAHVFHRACLHRQKKLEPNGNSETQELWCPFCSSNSMSKQKKIPQKVS